jgi:hypothetical protein
LDVIFCVGSAKYQNRMGRKPHGFNGIKALANNVIECYNGKNRKASTAVPFLAGEA